MSHSLQTNACRTTCSNGLFLSYVTVACGDVLSWAYLSDSNRRLSIARGSLQAWGLSEHMKIQERVN